MANGNKWKLRAKISRGARALYITGSPILSARTGESPTFTVTAGGGTPPYTFSKLSGTFATGWSLGASTGIMSGTLTVAASFTSVIRVTDSASPAATADLPSFTTVVSTPASAFTVAITAPGSAVTTVAIQSFGALVTGTYTAPLVFSIQDTQYYPLPTGISINSSTGVISGTATEDGYYDNIVVVATDNVGAVGYATPFPYIVHKTGAVVAPAHTDYIQQRTDAFTTTANAVVSLQAQTFKGRQSGNPDPEGSMWYGTTSWPTLTIPPDVARLATLPYSYRTGSTVDQTLRGGLFQGEVSLTADRHVLDLYYTSPATLGGESHNYINSAGLLTDGGTSHKTSVYRGRFDRCWDSIQGVPGATPYQTSLITECWITNCRDDAIEHDFNSTTLLESPMTISDCLVDGCQAFLSLAPDGAQPSNVATLVSVDSCVIRCEAYPQSSGTAAVPVDPLHYKALAPFKVGNKSCSLAVTNCIIAVNFDLATCTAGDKANMHGYYVAWEALMTNGTGSSSNNKFLWTSDDALPGTGWLGNFGTGGAGVTGWTVYTGSTARDILGAAREAWIIAHPWVRKRTAYTPGSVST